jgi:hypothetical protein
MYLTVKKKAHIPAAANLLQQRACAPLGVACFSA